MKKLWLFLFVFIPFSVKAIGASSYIVMDQDSGRVLEGKNTEKVSLIASITKIMTAIVAIEYGNLEEVVEVDSSIIKAYGSGVYVQIGEELTLDDLLYGLMLRSGNDAALAIASHVAGDVSSFVYLMNDKARLLGMNNTIFVNPSGLEENDGSANTSTVYDMAILTKYAMKNEHYRRIVSTEDIIVKSSLKTYKWFNKNKLLSSYEYCTGGKTGFTKKARRTLVTTATKDEMSLIVVTFNDGNDFGDHRSLYEKYFNSYERVKVIDKEMSYGEEFFLNSDFYVIVNNKDKIETKVSVDSLDGKIYGNIVGRIDVLLNGEEIGYRYLYYKKKSVTEDKSFISKLLDYLKFW